MPELNDQITDAVSSDNDDEVSKGPQAPRDTHQTQEPADEE